MFYSYRVVVKGVAFSLIAFRKISGEEFFGFVLVKIYFIGITALLLSRGL
jgi:type IV secretory pathway TrbL component